MDIDTDEPPDLVDVSLDPGRSSNFEPPTTELSDLAVSTVPLTIITGYLGSGKTTLVNYILNAQHGKKIAVILNEFGDSANIEQRAISISDIDRSQSIDFLTLGNGCICCSVKDAGLNAIEQLLARHASAPGIKPFDAIVLETSGLADPGGIIPNFWTDEGLGSSVRLDGVVCVVDAGNVTKALDEPRGEEMASTLDDEDEASQRRKDEHGAHETVAHLQISAADAIILNKTDTVKAAQLEAAEERIRSINSAATITKTSYGRIPQLEGNVLDLHAYDRFDPRSLEGRPHGHLDPTMTTITISLPPLTPNQLALLETWLQSLLWEHILLRPSTATSSPSASNPTTPTTSTFSAASTPFPLGTGAKEHHPSNPPTPTIHRIKALFDLTDGTERMIQAVRAIYNITVPEPAPCPSRTSLPATAFGDYRAGGDEIMLSGNDYLYAPGGGVGAESAGGGRGPGGKEDGEVTQEGKITFIGRGIDEGALKGSLYAALGL